MRSIPVSFQHKGDGAVHVSVLGKSARPLVSEHTCGHVSFTGYSLQLSCPGCMSTRGQSFRRLATDAELVSAGHEVAKFFPVLPVSP